MLACLRCRAVAAASFRVGGPVVIDLDAHAGRGAFRVSGSPRRSSSPGVTETGQKAY